MSKWVMCVGLFSVGLACISCATHVPEASTRQADIGLGIVEGTKRLSTIRRRSRAEKGYCQISTWASASSRRWSICRAYGKSE